MIRKIFSKDPLPKTLKLSRGLEFQYEAWRTLSHLSSTIGFMYKFFDFLTSSINFLTNSINFLISTIEILSSSGKYG